MGKTRVLVMVGTRRGAFLLESDRSRTRWSARGPLANAGWAFHHMSYDPATGMLYAAAGNAWYGAAVWTSPDLGETWRLSSEGMTYGDQGPGIRRIWNVTPAHGTVYAGVDPAGLFRSDDRGATWTHLPGLRLHPDYPSWTGGRGGLGLHSILPHPADARQLWVAMAGGGVLHTADGGLSWAARNPVAAGPGGAPRPLLRAQKLALAAGAPDRLYQQNHGGVFRSRDGGRSWQDVTAGLPTRFGFPLAVHPTDPEALYVIPHTNEDGSRFIHGGRIAVWRSRDGGQTWAPLTRGLPPGQTYVKTLRDGMGTDTLTPAGIYFGTSSGHLFASTDGGETWRALATHLPEIHAVAATVVPGD